jgi:hypothetical protein
MRVVIHPSFVVKKRRRGQAAESGIGECRLSHVVHDWTMTGRSLRTAFTVGSSSQRYHRRVQSPETLVGLGRDGGPWICDASVCVLEEVLMRAFNKGCVLAALFVAYGIAVPARAQTDVERRLLDASVSP